MYTTIPFNLVRFDVDENGASGNQYVPATGIYTNTGTTGILAIMNAKIRITAVAAGTEVRLRFLVNGVPSAEKGAFVSGAYLEVFVSQIVNVPAGATVAVQVYHTDADVATIYAIGVWTYFSLNALTEAI